MNKPFIVYTAIGDSLTKGRGTLFSPNFVERYAQRIESVFHKKVIIHRFCRSGLTSRQILTMFSDPFIRCTIYYSDIITITAGGNDFIKSIREYFSFRNLNVIQRAGFEAMMNITQMIAEIKEIKAYVKSPYLIRIVDLYNPVPFLPDSDFWIQSFNKQLQTLMDHHIAVTNIYPIFKKEGKKLLAFDRVHPNKHGYEIIAESLHLLGYGSLILS